MGEIIQTREPATGQPLWRGESGDVDSAVSAVRAGWPRWAALQTADRANALRRFGHLLKAQEDALTDLIARETGRPLWDARDEVTTTISRIDQSIAAYGERTGQKRLNAALGGTQAVRHRPHGVVAVLGSHSLPLDLPTGHIVPALLAGNALVLKPSEKAPATGEKLIALLHEAGVPADVLRCVQGGPETGKSLVIHPAVRAIFFTGSAQTGLAIARATGGNPEKLLALSMGGNNPVVLWDTPDLASAAAIIVQSAFLGSGQRCTAARRLIIKADLFQPAMATLLDLVDRLIIDHPHADPAPWCGPMIDMVAADALTESFLYLMSHGGKPLRHMQRPKPGLPYVSPGVIDVTAMAKRPDVELFGPLLQIVRVDDFEAAMAEAAETRFGLSAALIGGSPEQFESFWANVPAGIVNWNRPTTATAPTAPSGGIGLSGNSRPSGWYAADHCAWPVATQEAVQPRAMIGVGLRPAAAVIADR
jgi:succinylglutamic semialdehyde dehydrogenase